MPRKYVRKLGARPYKDYSLEDLEKILLQIEKKEISAREAQKKYGIHRNVLNIKLKQRKLEIDRAANKPVKAHGGQTVLSADVEKVFVSHIVAIAAYGFPITSSDLRIFVQTYLNRIGRRVPKFENNLPGRDWARCFLERHKKELSQRMSQNISRARSNVDETVIQSFFDHLALELENVPPRNIWNYDETNVTDDPGSKKVGTYLYIYF